MGTKEFRGRRRNNHERAMTHDEVQERHNALWKKANAQQQNDKRITTNTTHTPSAFPPSPPPSVPLGSPYTDAKSNEDESSGVCVSAVAAVLDADADAAVGEVRDSAGTETEKAAGGRATGATEAAEESVVVAVAVVAVVVAVEVAAESSGRYCAYCAARAGVRLTSVRLEPDNTASKNALPFNRTSTQCKTATQTGKWQRPEPIMVRQRAMASSLTLSERD